jgi:ABC-2 type transport system ATP-binding protein
MTDAALTSTDLGKRYRSKWALSHCDVNVPAGSVTALLGPNGAGKTTLLQLAAGLIEPTTGQIEVLGSVPRQDTEWLAGIGYLAQDIPLYRRLTGEQILGVGAHCNPAWDKALARDRLVELGIALDRPVSQLSGGERAQVALALCLGKRPRLLLLDEPLASLDPLARRDLLSTIAGAAAEMGVTVVLSSHLVADVERVCDYLVLLSQSQVQLAGDIDELRAGHRWLTGPRRDVDEQVGGHEVVTVSHTARQTTVLVRTSGPVIDPAWDEDEVGLEDLVLAYMGRDQPPERRPEPRPLEIVEEARR